MKRAGRAHTDVGPTSNEAGHHHLVHQLKGATLPGEGLKKGDAKP